MVWRVPLLVLKQCMLGSTPTQNHSAFGNTVMSMRGVDPRMGRAVGEPKVAFANTFVEKVEEAPKQANSILAEASQSIEVGVNAMLIELRA